MRDLKELLHEAAEPGPADGLDLGVVLEGARSRVRRRRVAVVLGAGAVVAAVVSGSVLASGVGLGIGDRIAPARDTEPVGPVIGFADARPAIGGRDYTVLSTLTNQNLDRDSGVYYRGVTPDGLIVVEDGPRGKDWQYRLGLLDPRTDEVDWLTEPTNGMNGADPSRLVGSSMRWVVWEMNTQRGDMAFLSFDRSTGRRVELEVPASRLGLKPSRMPNPGYAMLGPGDRIYFSVMEDEEPATLWSVPPDDAASLRREGTVGGGFDIDGDLLTFTKGADPSRIVVRNLRTGEETGFDMQSGSSCNPLGFDLQGDVIALGQYCGEKDGVRDDRLQLVSAAGEPIVTLRGHGLGAGALTDRYVMVSGDEGKAAGAYVYDLRSRELLKVSDGAVKFGTTLYGQDDLLTWATPVNKRHGMKLWAVSYHPQ